MLGETLRPPSQTKLPHSGDKAHKNLLKGQQELEAHISMMLKKQIPPPTVQVPS